MKVDKDDYEGLILKWIHSCEDIKDGARDIIEVLEAAQLGSTRVISELQSGNSVTTAASAATDILNNPGASGSGMNGKALTEPQPQPMNSTSLLEVIGSVPGSIVNAPITMISGAS